MAASRSIYSPSPAVAAARARLAGLHRRGARDPDDPAVTDARRELEIIKLVEHAQKVADRLPPLTEAQVERVAALLRIGSGRKAAG